MQDVYVRHRVYVDVLAGDLWIAEDLEGELYFPLRPTCAALDLDSPTALATIKADSRLQPGLRHIKLPTAGGDQAQQCLASTEYSWWLALIDPRRFLADRRPLLQERQRVLMRLAKEILLQRGQVYRIPANGAGSAVQAEATGSVETHFRCLKCGAPHIAVIDGTGWHIHLGVDVRS
jgi:hypothetical protein